MLALFQLGSIFENYFTKKQYLLTYFLSGIAGNVISIIYIYYIDQNINVIGASGAIFGIFAFISMVMNNLKSFFIQTLIFHLLILIVSMNIAWYAHLGGIIIGLLLGYFYKKTKQRLYFI
jgi:membrane associated rhomboid family serine protease